jgi:hypothetical protein
MLTGIIQRRPHNGQGPSFLQMAAAFVTGMILTAAIALIPVAQSTHDSVVPALPEAPSHLEPGGSTDAGSPFEAHITELVYTPTEKFALSC